MDRAENVRQTGLFVYVFGGHYEESEVDIKLHNFRGLKLFNLHNSMQSFVIFGSHNRYYANHLNKWFNQD